MRYGQLGNQQITRIHFNKSNLYAPVLKAREVWLLVSIAAQQSTTMYKYNTSQAFLHGDMEEKLYARAPDWWPEPVPDGYCLHTALQLRKNMHRALTLRKNGTRQAAWAWHILLSIWMEEHEYLSFNNEKTIFMKWEVQEFILIRVFVDDFSAIPTTQTLKEEFESRDPEHITRGGAGGHQMPRDARSGRFR